MHLPITPTIMESVVERLYGLGPPQVYVPASESSTMLMVRADKLRCVVYLSDVLLTEKHRDIPTWSLEESKPHGFEPDVRL